MWEGVNVTSQPFTLGNDTGHIVKGDTEWRSWLRHCATSQKVAASIPDEVIWIFH
jgi:hypothetical protein